MDPDIIRAWLSDGAFTLQSVEQALDRAFGPETLRYLAEEGARLGVQDSPAFADLTRAKDEVEGYLRALAESGDTDVPLAVIGAGAFLAGVGLAIVVLEVEAAIHGHPGPLPGGYHAH